MKSRRAAAWLAAAALAACNAPKVAYNHLGWLASVQVGKYVDLEGPSRTVFERGFEDLWKWHRATQLTLYSKDLRELARTAQQPMTKQQVRDYGDRVSRYGRRLFDEALPSAARVFGAMEDTEAANLVANINGKRAERAREFADPDDSRHHDVKDMTRQLKRWVGPLDAAQRQRVEDWAAARRYEPALTQLYWQHWMQRFTALLALRAQPGFASSLRAQFLEPQVPERGAYDAMRRHNAEQTIALLADLSRSLSAEQRRQLKARLEELAADLDTLASQPQQAALPVGMG